MFNFIKNLINFEKMESFLNSSNNFKNKGIINDSVVNTGNNVHIEINKDRHITEENKKYLLDFLKNNRTVNNMSIQYENSAEAKQFAEEVGSFLKGNKINIFGLEDSRQCTGFSRDLFSIEPHPSDLSFSILKIGPHY